jgi:hypothetical protein
MARSLPSETGQVNRILKGARLPLRAAWISLPAAVVDVESVVGDAAESNRALAEVTAILK